LQLSDPPRSAAFLPVDFQAGERDGVAIAARPEKLLPAMPTAQGFLSTLQSKKPGATLLALVSLLGGNHSQKQHRLQHYLRRRDKRCFPKNENSPSRTNPRGVAFA